MAVPMFSNSEEKPTGSPQPSPEPLQTLSTHNVAPVAALTQIPGPEGVAAALYLFGMLALMLGGLIFAFAETSIHEILATLIGLMGAIFFAAGAVVTELQRIKKQLQADAIRLAANNPQP
jgi:predicted lipid-binding transport protein (Tim44 family)